MLEYLLCLYAWRREELNYSDKRTSKRQKKSERFAVMSLSLEIVPEPEMLDGDEDSDDIELVQEALTEDLAEEEEAAAQLLEAELE